VTVVGCGLFHFDDTSFDHKTAKRGKTNMSKLLVRAGLCAFIFAGLLLCAESRVQGGTPPDRPAPTGPTKLLRYADISKDSVVFSYAGDLWTASRQGGSAHRLTSGAGDKLYPKFSPDGKWVAFTASYDGNPDVYVVAAEGGEPRRLTFHPSNDIVLGWTPDGKNVLFRSDRVSAPPQRTTRLFLVSPQGGIPKVLPVPYFLFTRRQQNRVHRNIPGKSYLETVPRGMEHAHRYL
jgi:hypothetical protein